MMSVISRAALSCQTPPGLEGSKGRPALMGVREVLKGGRDVISFVSQVSSIYFC